MFQPHLVTERALLESLLLALQGYPSQHFALKKEGFEQRHYYHFSHLTEGAVSSVVQPVLQVSNRLLFFRRKAALLLQEPRSLALQAAACQAQKLLQRLARRVNDLHALLLAQAGQAPLSSLPATCPDPDRQLTLLELSAMLACHDPEIQMLTRLLKSLGGNQDPAKADRIDCLQELLREQETSNLADPAVNALIAVFSAMMTKQVGFLISWF
jgi:hypothetical protein